MSRELSIALGYITSFVFMALVIAIGEGVQKKFNTDKEMTRKCEHIATSASFAMCYFFVGATIHLVIVNFIAMCILALLTFGNFMKSAERTDSDKSYGLFFFGISTFTSICITMVVNTDFIPFAAIAYYCLALADGLAPVTSRLFGKANVTMYKPKTLVGFATVFAVSSLVALVCSGIFSLSLTPLFLLSLGSVAAHAELYGRGGFDNITVNFAVFGYLILNYFGFVTLPVQIALLLAPLMTFAASKTGALTMYAGAASFIYLVASALFGGHSLVALICILFVLEAIMSKITGKMYYKHKEPKDEKHARSAYQVISVSAISLLCTVVYYYTDNQLFFFAAVVAIMEQFADSAASDIGRLSKNQPIDIVRFKRIECGVSGGVSLVGSLAALAAAAASSAIFICFERITLGVFLSLVAIAFFGTALDSVLGSLIQGLFRCRLCDTILEQNVHCGNKTECIKGCACVDNSMVNLLTGILTSVVAIGAIALVI